MDDIQAQINTYNLMRSFFGDVDKDYDPEKDVLPQYIFKKSDIAIGDYLMSLRKNLIDDFLTGYNSLEEAIYTVGRNVMQKKEDRLIYGLDSPDNDGSRFPDPVEEIVRTENQVGESIKNPNGWKNVELRYHDPYRDLYWDIDPEYAKQKYPTAYNLVQEFGDDCPICSYSYLAPNTSIYRHTGPENRDGKYVRIHIPLMVPPGDLFLEVNGDEVTWGDLFAFDNQFAHSAHNLSNEHRLILLIDVSRERLGLPSGEKWNRNRQIHAMSKPFIRKQK